ncbi:methyltransferase domain-containing protein [Candidatus Synechococcus calcipolaris G9]|uniref:Methyltransferase domain-containing protein n=1 Tax=Candidatus Synechococcus calcipolaris G9 TaxID=1497997 RepID=A0ABT6EYY6_9SYNE|nr:methyltransferase domain-containing protein [Candidatus Synechococcus calcipolaris]MDG2990666.1 methyltransferase domain-containing protein [Candidatus Synechococcus calcipolaris G9]
MTEIHQKETNPSYGRIDHYVSDKGQAYFQWQAEDGLTQANYNKHIWQNYVLETDDVLDFGCGGGFLLNALQAHKKVGVEINPHARKNAAELGIDVYATIEEVSGAFDKVISSHALEHVPHPRQAILALKEKLKDQQSRMILLLPLDDWRSSYNREYKANDVNMHLYTWTPQLLGNLLSSCDMRIEMIKVINHAWPPKKELLWQLSPQLFHLAATAWSVISKQRQLLAIATLA